MAETPANAFIGKSKRPTEREITAELGPSKPVWDKLLLELRRDFRLKPEWKSYSIKTGWMLRMRSGERAIVYMSPWRGRIKTALILGDKAIKTAIASGLPARTAKLIAEGKRYPEGTAVRLEVKGPAGAAMVKKLAAIKLGN